MKNSRYYYAVITLLGRVFVFGGKRNENDNVYYIKESEWFNIKKKQWEDLQCLPKALRNPVVCSSNF